MITELLDGGDLYEKLKIVKHFTEYEAWVIFKQLADAITYI